MRTGLVALVVVVHAAIQALLVLGDPTPALSWGFALVAVASFVAVVAAVWGVAALVTRPHRPRALVLRVVVLTVVAAAASLLSPLALPVVLVLGTPFLTGRPHRGPVRAILLVLAGLVLAALSWLGAFAAGFFLAVPVAAVLTWLWFGAITALLLAGWAALARPRAEPDR